jgi:hypothetical protein
MVESVGKELALLKKVEMVDFLKELQRNPSIFFAGVSR